MKSRVAVVMYFKFSYGKDKKYSTYTPTENYKDLKGDFQWETLKEFKNYKSLTFSCPLKEVTPYAVFNC